MPFKHFLSTSLNFERTHQLILQCLFNDPKFFFAANGTEAQGYHVLLEPEKGLFDIGIYDQHDEPLCLIELKMWSKLSNGQLQTQAKYLETHNCNGAHILLGSSSLQFHRGDNYDDITDQTHGFSRKIGYEELDIILERFIRLSTPDAPITIIAQDYKEALKKQADYIHKAWLNPKADLHLRSYSAYSNIRKHLLKDRFYIYSVNNPGGTSHILNDDASWTKFKFKGHQFEIYQEMLDMELMIRIYSDNVPNHIRKLLKEKVIRQLQQLDPNKLSWNFDSRTSKYHKIAMYKPELKTEADCLRAAEIFQALNPVIKAIAKEVQDKQI